MVERAEEEEEEEVEEEDDEEENVNSCSARLLSFKVLSGLSIANRSATASHTFSKSLTPAPGARREGCGCSK